MVNQAASFSARVMRRPDPTVSISRSCRMMVFEMDRPTFRAMMLLFVDRGMGRV